MSKRSRDGKRIWRERGGTLAAEIADRITADAAEQMHAWAARGRVPSWVRAKARLRRALIVTRRGGEAR